MHCLCEPSNGQLRSEISGGCALCQGEFRHLFEWPTFSLAKIFRHPLYCCADKRRCSCSGGRGSWKKKSPPKNVIQQNIPLINVSQSLKTRVFITSQRMISPLSHPTLLTATEFSGLQHKHCSTKHNTRPIRSDSLGTHIRLLPLLLVGRLVRLKVYQSLKIGDDLLPNLTINVFQISTGFLFHSPWYRTNTSIRVRDALEGKGRQRQVQRRSDRRLEEVAKAVGGGYCRLPTLLKLAPAVSETAPGHRLGGLEGLPPPLPTHPCPGLWSAPAPWDAGPWPCPRRAAGSAGSAASTWSRTWGTWR